MTPDEQYWRDRDRQVATERVAIFAAVGATDWHGRLPGDDNEYKIVADPEDPSDGEFMERKFFLDAPVMEHDRNGMVTGIGMRRYRIVLEEESP